MAWTDEKVEKLKLLWAEGITAAEIAKALGDVSRNAVIGKAHRLGLSNRGAAPKNAELEPEEPQPLVETPSNKKEASPTVASEAPKAAEPKATAATRSAPQDAAQEAAPKTRADDALAAPGSNAFEPATEMDGEEEGVNPVAALAAEAERNARKLHLLELNERTCKWPIGDPSTDDFYFCGLPCAPEKPYCAAHVQVAYQPMSSRRDRERTRARAASA
ncbi:MAG: GcrA cell cycle regulator [Neomegalonema sp.]|nr:GcrA cell cycle regulator [Neomegalonema sp.]